MLGGAAAGHHDRPGPRGPPVAKMALAQGSRGLADRRPPGSPQDSPRERRFGRDHVGHVVRRPGAPAGSVGSSAHGSGGPGRGAVGSKLGAMVDSCGRSEDRRPRPIAWRLARARRPRAAPRRPRRMRSPWTPASPIRYQRRTIGGRMQVGLMAPQGWKGEYDGWSAAGLGPDGRARRAGRGARFESLWVFDHFHTVPARPTRSPSSRSRRHRPGDGESASGSVTWSSAPGSAIPRSRPSWLDLDVISGGRFELGIGAGWKEEEWRAYGYGFPTLGERMAALGDHLEVIRGCSGPAVPRSTANTPRSMARSTCRRASRAAHPDHRRRQRPAGDGGLRDPIRRRAQLRLPRSRGGRRADRRRSARAARLRAAIRHAALLALHEGRGGARRRPGAGRYARALRGGRAGPPRLLPDALVPDARGPGGLRRGLPRGRAGVAPRVGATTSARARASGSAALSGRPADPAPRPVPEPGAPDQQVKRDGAVRRESIGSPKPAAAASAFESRRSTEPGLVLGEFEEAIRERRLGHPAGGDALDGELLAVGFAEDDDRPAARPARHGLGSTSSQSPGRSRAACSPRRPRRATARGGARGGRWHDGAPPVGGAFAARNGVARQAGSACHPGLLRAAGRLPGRVDLVDEGEQLLGSAAIGRRLHLRRLLVAFQNMSCRFGNVSRCSGLK